MESNIQVQVGFQKVLGVSRISLQVLLRAYYNTGLGPLNCSNCYLIRIWNFVSCGQGRGEIRSGPFILKMCSPRIMLFYAYGSVSPICLPEGSCSRSDGFEPSALSFTNSVLSL